MTTPQPGDAEKRIASRSGAGMDRLSYLKTVGCRPHGRGFRSPDDPLSSRHKSASLSLRSRKVTAAGLLGWVFSVALAAVATPPAKTAILELLMVYRSSALIDWINPQALAATVFILVFFGCTTLLGPGLDALLKVTILRKRLRSSTFSAFYPGRVSKVTFD